MRFLYIIDDDRVSRCVIQTIAARDTATLVRGFASGRDFLDEADELDPGVMLLDLNMPELDGTEVLERMAPRHRGKFVPVLVTATASVCSAVLAMKLGAVDVVEKPCAPAALEEALVIAFGRLEACRTASIVAGEAKRKIDSLSPRERDVMGHLFDGKANKTTAFDLGISARTVEIYRASAMKKLGVKHLANAVRLAVVAGWEPADESGSGWAEAAADMRIQAPGGRPASGPRHAHA